MSEAKTYRIETVEDFLAVPLERRADCLHEFQVVLACLDLAVQLSNGAVERPLVFNWVDDGLRNIRMTMENEQESIVLVDGTMKPRP